MNRSRQSSVTSNSQENLMAAAAAQMREQQQLREQQAEQRRGSNTLTRKGSGIPLFQSPIKAGNRISQMARVCKNERVFCLVNWLSKGSLNTGLGLIEVA